MKSFLPVLAMWQVCHANPCSDLVQDHLEKIVAGLATPAYQQLSKREQQEISLSQFMQMVEDKETVLANNEGFFVVDFGEQAKATIYGKHTILFLLFSCTDESGPRIDDVEGVQTTRSNENV